MAVYETYIAIAKMKILVMGLRNRHDENKIAGAIIHATISLIRHLKGMSIVGACVSGSPNSAILSHIGKRNLAVF